MTRILPNGENSFTDNNGNPLAAGLVYFYVPGTSTPKNTWRDADKTILNSNPILLDAGGRCQIWGEGQYRQIVTDATGVQIWDDITSSGEGSPGLNWGGTSGGISNNQTVTVPGFEAEDGASFQFIAGTSNSGPTMLTVNLDAPAPLYALSSDGPQTLEGGEIVEGNLYILTFVEDLGGYVIVNSNSILINTLPEAEDVKPEDLTPIYSVTDLANQQARVMDWLKVIALLDDRPQAKIEDKLLIFNSDDEEDDGQVVNSIEAKNFLKVIGDLSIGQATDPSIIYVVGWNRETGSVKRYTLEETGGLRRAVKIGSADSGDATLELKDLGGWNSIFITLESMVPDTDDNKLRFRVSIDNGDNWISTGYLNSTDNTVTGRVLVNDAPTGQKVSNGVNNNGLNGQLFIGGWGRATGKTITGFTGWKEPGSDVSGQVMISFVSGSQSANALQFDWESGNFSRGKVYVEGLE